MLKRGLRATMPSSNLVVFSAIQSLVLDVCSKFFSACYACSVDMVCNVLVPCETFQALKFQ
jgi:hypothetical protein